MTAERTTLAASALGMLTLGMNGTAIMAALPTMRHDLGLTQGELEWAINAYLIVSAACIVPGGKACDRFGPGRVSIAGLALFAIAACVVATAQTAVVLLAGRALQGLAAALSVPGTLAAINQASPPERRASAIGAWAGFLMLGFSVGPLIGGALTHYLDWRDIFWISGVVMLTAAGGFAIRPGAPAVTAQPGRFDWLGFVLVATFMISLLWALHMLPAATSAPAMFLGSCLLAAAAFVALLYVEQRLASPLIDLGVFRETAFVRAVALGSIAMASILTLLMYYNLYAQSPAGLGLSSVGAGLSLLPLSGGLLIFAFSAPALIRRFGARRAIGCANLVIALAAVAVAAAATTHLWIPLLIGLFAIGMGLALPYATAPRLALATLPPASAGGGSGIINACTFLAGSMGIAIGAPAFAQGSLLAVMSLVAVLVLIGAILCRGLPTKP